MMMSRRTFTSMLAASLTAALIPTVARAGNRPEARNVVLVHGLFADGSSWSEVIPRLQAAGLNVTSVQNPLTTLEDAVPETQRVLSRKRWSSRWRLSGWSGGGWRSRAMRWPIPSRRSQR